MADSTFEKDRYFDWMGEHIRDLKALCCELAFYAANNSRTVLDETMKQILSKGSQSESVLKRDALLCDADKAFERKVMDALKSNNSFNINDPDSKTRAFRYLHDKKSLDLYRIKTQSLDDVKYASLCRKMICNYSDEAAALKYIYLLKDTYKYGFPKEYEKRMKSITNSNWKKFLNNAYSCSALRNRYIGHKTDADVEEVTRARYEQDRDKVCLFLKDISRLPDIPKIKKLWNNLVQNIDTRRKLIGLMPLSCSYLTEKIPGFQEDILIDKYIFAADYDRKNKVLYWHRIDEVQEVIEKRMEEDKALRDKIGALELENEKNAEIKNAVKPLLDLLKGELREEFYKDYSMESGSKAYKVISKNPLDENINKQTAKRLQGGEYRVKDTQEKFSFLGLFPNLTAYQGGPLSDEVLNELAEKTTMMADADFWMGTAESKYLAYQVAPVLHRYDRRLLIDWNTRTELFRHESNLHADSTPEQIKSAKRAHNIMHLMNAQRYASYLPANKDLYSSQTAILKLAQSHPDSMFTIFTNSSDYCKRLLDEGVQNIIPVFYNPVRETCAIKLEPLDFVKKGLNGDNHDKKNSQLLSDSQDLGFSEIDNAQGSEIAKEQSPVKAPATTSAATPEKKEKPASVRKEVSSSKKKMTASSQIHLETNILLGVEKIPGEGDCVFDKKGEKILLKSELGKGGEGTVYAVEQSGIVAKIYHQDKLTETRRDKLQAMVDTKNSIKKLCWPTRLLYNEEKQFVGYLMKSAAGYKEFGMTVLKLNSDTVLQQEMPGWDRKALVDLCVSLCDTFQKMHQAGILMGDVNARNMMIRTNSSSHNDYLFVDCDSYQFAGYPCPVGTEVFTSPKLYERYHAQAGGLNLGKVLRTIEDENYSFASLLFHILMLNQSPFSGKGTTDLMEAIRQYNFAFRLKGDKENTGADTPDGDYRMIWNNMPGTVKELFGKVFKHGENVDVSEWKRALSQYQAQIRSGVYTSELKPQLYWDTKDRDFTVDFRCDACGEVRNMPKERFELQNKIHEPHLCNRCSGLRETLKKNRCEVTCPRCKKKYEISQWDGWKIQKGFRKTPICKECKDMFMIGTCDECGKRIRILKTKYKDLKSKGKSLLCHDCLVEKGYIK